MHQIFRKITYELLKATIDRKTVCCPPLESQRGKTLGQTVHLTSQQALLKKHQLRTTSQLLTETKN